MNIKKFFEYGEKVDGYDIRVLNEREARAGAGILFAVGIISLLNAIFLGHGIVTRFFIAFFTLDFLIRVIQPRYAPSLLLGRLFVKEQTPEYVGAVQKRFAWSIGLALAIPMFYLLVINWQPSPIKVAICVLCLLLLFFETAFSICLGCKLFEFITRNKSQYCPGGACEIKKKEKVQTFTTAQKIILSVTIVAIVAALYSYTYKVTTKSHLGIMIQEKMMSEEEIKLKEQQEWEAEQRAFEEDDDF